MNRSRATADSTSLSHFGRSRRRLVVWGGAGAGVVILVALAGWLGWTAQRARSELMAARGELPAVRAAVLSGDGSGASHLDVVRGHARTADRLTHDPVWSVVGSIPVVGSPIATTAGMTRSVRVLADDGMGPLVTAADTLHPAQLLRGGRMDVAGLERAEPDLARAATTLRAQRSVVAALSPSWLGPVSRAHAELLTELSDLSGASSAAAGAARLLPPMLGVDGPRRYFVAFQNPAEARASGGLLDAFAILVADHGQVRVERLGANSQLPPQTTEVTDVDTAFAARYGPIGATSAWLEANVSPHFPDVAGSWEAMWQQTTGQRVDGTIALTPRALATVLTATGPVTTPVVGAVDAGRVERLVYHEQYAMRGFTDNTVRKSAMLSVGSATIDALLAGRARPGVLLPGLREAASDGNVLVHSRTEAEQVDLEAAGIAGAVDATDRPYAQAVVLNASGNKLDSWLSSSLDYRVRACTPKSRTARITVTLRNDAPTRGLPDYVTVRSDRPPYPVRPSQNRSELEVLLTRGATLQSATLDGAPMATAPAEGTLPATLPSGAATTFLQTATTRGRPSFWLDLELVPGSPRTLVLTVTEPPSTAPPLLPRQVMVKPMEVRSDMGACSDATTKS